MSIRSKLKMIVDLAMTAALPMLMCYSIVGETAHEVIGTAMFCLFILHHILNINWVKNVFKGSYNLRRGIGTAVNALVFLCMIGLMYSGIVISKHVFSFLRLGGAMTARTLHMLCAYWGLVFMSVHLGMHIDQMSAKMKLRGTAPAKVFTVVFALAATVGAYEFIELKFADYMFGQVQFVFIDLTASAVLTTLKYLSVMVLFAEAGYWLCKAVSKKTAGK